jgi:hypothetical protein
MTAKIFKQMFDFGVCLKRSVDLDVDLAGMMPTAR